MNFRSTVITAIKFVVTDQPQPQDDLLKSSVGDFLSCLVDPDIKVRRVALVAFNSIAHNKPSLVSAVLVVSECLVIIILIFIYFAAFYYRNKYC